MASRCSEFQRDMFPIT